MNIQFQLIIPKTISSAPVAGRSSIESTSALNEVSSLDSQVGGFSASTLSFTLNDLLNLLFMCKRKD